MKKVLCILGLFVSINTFAAGKEGGGGGVHVCNGAVELYDLYEEREIHNEPLVSVGQMSEAQVESLAMDRLAQVTYGYPRVMEKAFTFYDKYFEFTEEELDIVPDVSDLHVKPGCQYKQLAVWKNRKLRVNRKWYNALDNLGKVAFKFHEAIYFVRRIESFYMVEFSDKSRRTNASLFRRDFVLDALPEYPFRVGGAQSLEFIGYDKGVDKYKVAYVPSKAGCLDRPNYDLEIKSDDFNMKIYDHGKAKKGYPVIIQNAFYHDSWKFLSFYQNLKTVLEVVPPFFTKGPARVTVKLINRSCNDVSETSFLIHRERSNPAKIEVRDEVNSFFDGVNYPKALNDKQCLTKLCKCNEVACVDFLEEVSLPIEDVVMPEE